MADITTTKGLWWLPDEPGRQLVGEIVYGAHSGAKLSLLDHFFKERELGSFTVWGITVQGKPLSLFNCHTKNLTMHIPGARVAEISSNFGVAGGHFRSPDEMRFATVSADLSYLHEWAWTSGIKVAPSAEKNGWQITHSFLRDIPLCIVADFHLKLHFWSHLSPDYGNLELSEKCVFAVESKELTPYKLFEEIIHKFQQFVALGVSRPVYALSITGRVDKPKQVVQGHEIYEDFEILRDVSLKDDVKKSLIPSDMQFCLGDLQPSPIEFVKNYFDKHDLLDPVCSLYFSTLYNREMLVDQRLLSLAHAVEAYHRVFIGGKYQPDDEYRGGLQKIIWDAIPENLDADFRASLKNKLKYLHEFSLRKRLQDICAKHAAVLRPFLGDVNQFAGGVADQRNLLVHQDSTSEDRPKEKNWKEVWLKGEQLSLLVEFCLLHEIGFDDATLARLIHRNRRTRSIQLNRNRNE